MWTRVLYTTFQIKCGMATMITATPHCNKRLNINNNKGVQIKCTTILQSHENILWKLHNSHWINERRNALKEKMVLLSFDLSRFFFLSFFALHQQKDPVPRSILSSSNCSYIKKKTLCFCIKFHLRCELLFKWLPAHKNIKFTTNRGRGRKQNYLKRDRDSIWFKRMHNKRTNTCCLDDSIKLFNGCCVPYLVKIKLSG